VNGSEVFVTLQPCVTCAKTLINAGIVAVHFRGTFPDELSMEIFKEAGTRLVRMD
jgi:dCMP deaminase